MMTTMCDLPHDLVGEKILAKVPIISLKAVRSTCKLWNALSKDFLVGKATLRQHEFLGFMTMCNKIYSLRFDLRGILNRDYLAFPFMKQVGLLDQVEISNVFHCDGLVLCVTKDKSKLLVWNPYLGQIRRIGPRKRFNGSDIYALGYGNNHEILNYKILRIYSDDYCRVVEFEIYDFSSDSWSVLDVVSDYEIHSNQRGVTLKGCTYLIGRVRSINPLGLENVLLGFDYTKERFGQRLPLPFTSYVGTSWTLSCVREEKISVLYQKGDISATLEIWVTNKIEPNAVSWSKFLKVDMRFTLINCLRVWEAGSFFINEEKKVAVVIHKIITDLRTKVQTLPMAYIIGEDRYFKVVEIRDVSNISFPMECSLPLVSSSYLPSLVQINQPRKRKEREV